MIAAVDASHRLDPKALARHEIAAVGRYIGPFRKAIKLDELDELRAAGVGVWFIWETTATRALRGYTAGRDDASRAHEALDALGVPLDVGAFWTVDTDVTGFAPVADYAQGWRDHCHTIARRPAGVYGEVDVIDGAIDKGLVVAGWQTNARGWDSPRRISAHAAIVQHLPVDLDGLGNVDPNEIIDHGCPLIWWPDTAPPAPNPQELDVNEATLRKIIGEELDRRLNPDGKGNLLWRLRETTAKIDKRTRDFVTGARPSGRG